MNVSEVFIVGGVKKLQYSFWYFCLMENIVFLDNLKENMKYLFSEIVGFQETAPLNSTF